MIPGVKEYQTNQDGGSETQIVEVWDHNLQQEFKAILDLVEEYPYVALDTEFPGIVAHPSNPTGPDYNYRTVKCNVDLLKVIQLGITFADENGVLSHSPCTWQFNFKFDMTCDMYAQDSIEFLRSNGVDFTKMQNDGIDPHDFGELIIASGLVMNEQVRWISFHGCYDFGYLLKLLTCAPLPQSEKRFNELLLSFFPCLYDIKCLLKDLSIARISGSQSLQSVSEHLGVKRIGRQHQAGSDSLVTCKTFFRLIEVYFNNELDESRFSGIIYGLHIRSSRMRDPSEGLFENATNSMYIKSQMFENDTTLDMDRFRPRNHTLHFEGSTGRPIPTPSASYRDHLGHV